MSINITVPAGLRDTRTIKIEIDGLNQFDAAFLLREAADMLESGQQEIYGCAPGFDNRTVEYYVESQQ